MTAEIVDFPRAVTPATRKIVRRIIREETKAVREEALTTTAKNHRLRQQRWEAWRKADAITNYWCVRLRFADAIERAARAGLREALSHRDVDDESRWQVLESWREAERKQILTPAPDAAAVNWKRARMRDLIGLNLIGLRKERIEQVIADDMAFLSAHPTRRPRTIQQA